MVYPLQTLIPGTNSSLSELPDLLRDGARCVVGRADEVQCCDVDECALSTDGGRAAVFWVYCVVDFSTYLFGLLVIQKGGATLMVLTTAIALPLQQLVLCYRPLLGGLTERFFWGDALALVLVLVGFAAYQLCSPEGVAKRRAIGGGAAAVDRQPAAPPTGSGGPCS